MQGRNSKEQVQNEEQGTNPEVMCQLLDSPIRPILSHACEVWTSCTGAKGWQQVHKMFVRGILGVNKTTSTFAVSGIVMTFLVRECYGSPKMQELKKKL
jgi:hypothetical protein